MHRQAAAMAGCGESATKSLPTRGAVEANGTVRIELAAGEHRVTVTEGGTARVSFEVVCRKTLTVGLKSR